MIKKVKGTIRKRGEKFNALFPYIEDGKKKQKSATFDTEEEAVDWLEKYNLREEMMDGVSSTHALSVVNELWLEKKALNVNEKSMKTYKSASKVIIDNFSGESTNIEDIEEDDIVRFLGKIKKLGYEPKFYKGILSSWFIFSIKRRWRTTNPTLGVNTSRTNAKRTPIVADTNLKREIYNHYNTPKHMVQFYPVMIALFTGLRIGELCGLKWSCVDFNKKTITVKGQYTEEGYTTVLKSLNSYRTIGIDDCVIELLQELKESHYTHSIYVFGIYKVLRRRMERSLDTYFGMVPHDLRHTHATELQYLMPIADAAYRMGHSKEEYVSTYIHSTENSRKKLADKFNNAMVLEMENIKSDRKSDKNNVIAFK